MTDTVLQPLASAGFTVAPTRDWLVCVFPDGDAAWIVRREQASEIDVAALLELGRRRQTALAIIRALLADAGWGSRRDAGGEYRLGDAEGCSSRVHLGFPLSFWLQREPLVRVLRRFAAPFRSNLDADVIARLIEQAQSAVAFDPGPRAEQLYVAHLSRVGQIQDGAVKILPDPDQPLDFQAMLAEHLGENAAHAHRQQVSPNPLEQLAEVLQQARRSLQQGQAFWLGAQPLWADPGDCWVRREEWLAWATALEQPWMDGTEAVVLRFDPALLRERIRSKLLAGRREQTLEFDVDVCGVAAHFLDETEIAEWAIGIQPFRLPRALAEAGFAHALFESWEQLQRLALPWPAWQSAGPHPPHDLAELSTELGPLLAGLLTDGQRECLVGTCLELLSVRETEPKLAAVMASALSLAAWALQAPRLADGVLDDDFWRRALLEPCMGGYFVLKQALLALSLIRPGAACLALVLQTCAHMEWTYEAGRVDQTALALAVAWRRCVAAQAHIEG